MSVAEFTGESSSSTEDQLRALRARGFQFIDPRDADGEVVAVIGVRAHHNVIDVVRLKGEDDVTASRLPGDADILAPATVFWQQTGSACEVLGKLLALPDERGFGSIWVPNRCR
jgi:hypothetical protein